MRYILFLAVLSAAVFASAQSSVDTHRDSVKASHRIITFDNETRPQSQSHNDSIRQMIDMFYYDQFRNFSDPEAPYFMFMSKDASLAMGIGGAVRMRGYFDWHGAMPGPGFAPILIPMNPDPAAMRHFGTTPAGTCLFFRVIGRNKSIGHYQLYIEADFSGYERRDFRLKKAYAIVNDFTIGLANSTFSDPAALPPTVDAQGPANKISPANVLVRYMPTVKERWTFAISAETPSTAIDTSSGQNKAVDEWIPDGAAFIQYQWGPTSHIRLAGMVRSLSYRDLIAERNHYRTGWGVMLGSVAHPLPKLTYYLTANYGHGYSSLGGDLSIGNYDLIPDAERPGKLYAPASLGWCVGLQWNFTPDLFVCAQCSQTHLMPRNGTSDPDAYKHGTVAALNCFWNLTPRILLGAEFDWAKRTNENGIHRHANRVGALAMFSF